MCCGGVRGKRKSPGKACRGARSACDKIRGICEGRGVRECTGEGERVGRGGNWRGGAGAGIRLGGQRIWFGALTRSLAPCVGFRSVSAAT